MQGVKRPRRAQRIIAAVLVVAMVAGGIIADQSGLGRKGRGYENSQAYAYLYDSMESLSYGWLRWMFYLWGTHFSDEDSASGRYRRACVSVAEEDFAQAAEWMRAYMEGQTGLTDAQRAAQYLQLACMQSLDGDAVGAVASAQRAAQLDPSHPQTQQMYYQFSMDANAAANAAEALASYTALISDTSRYEEIADLYLQAGDYEESGRYYTLAIEADGEDQRLLYMRGNCRMQLGQYEEAIEDFSGSDMPGSLYSKGICEMALSDFDAAAASFEESIALGEQADEARMMLAVCRLQAGQYEQSLQLFDQYIQAGGDYAQIAYYQGTARMMLEDYSGAVEDFDASAAAGNFAQESAFAAAQCRFFIGEYQAAAEQFEQCVDAGFNTAQSQYYLGLCLAALGQNEEAEEALRQALGE